MKAGEPGRWTLECVRPVPPPALGDLLSCAEQPGRDRCLAHAQRTRGFAVGEAEHVDGHQRETAILGQSAIVAYTSCI